MRGFLLMVSLAAVLFLLLIRRGRSKRVLLLAQHIHVGGTSSYFRALCSYFTERGYEVQFLLRRREFTPEISSFLKQFPHSWHFVDHELDHIEYWYDRKHILRFYFLNDFLKQALILGRLVLKSRSSMLFVSNAYPGDLFPAFLLPMQIRFVIHSMPWGRLDRGNRYLLEKMIRFFPRHVRFTTVSAFAKNRILEHWKVKGLQDQITYLYNFSPLGNEAHYYPARSHKYVTVLTAGSVIDTKNPSLWIRVAVALIERHPGLSFVWAGDGKELNECRSRVSGLPGITFMGKADDMTSMYNQADIYFQPSKWESQGLAVLEAMSFGLPCVVTSNGGTAEMVADGVTGMVSEPDDEEGYTRQLEKLITDPATRQDMGKRAFHRYRQEFSVERWYARMDELIQV